MTNEELLQQAKDQHAKKFKVWGLMRTYRDWKEVESTAPISQIVQIGREAALLAIQKAREEGGQYTRVEDGLPPNQTLCLTWNLYEYQVSYFDRGHWSEPGTNFVPTRGHVTHWNKITRPKT